MKENNEIRKEKYNGILRYLGIVGIIFLLVAVSVVIVNYDTVTNFIKGNPDWVTEVNGVKVFNIENSRFKEDVISKLKYRTGLNIKESNEKELTEGTMYPASWIIAYDKKSTGYIYSSLHYNQEEIIKLIKIEHYQGKVISITYLKSTKSIPNTIVEEVVMELLEEYGIIKDRNKLDKHLSKKTEQIGNALLARGTYTESESTAQIYRNAGYYAPNEYNNNEVGEYVTISIK